MSESLTIADRFAAGTARIAYSELSQRGGNVIAWYRGGFHYHRHETQADQDATREAMSSARARFSVPSDAQVAA